MVGKVEGIIEVAIAVEVSGKVVRAQVGEVRAQTVKGSCLRQVVFLAGFR